MATFQMEMRQQQEQEQEQEKQQRTNLKQRETATAATAAAAAATLASSTARRQRQERDQQHSDPPEISTDCSRLWPGSSCNTVRDSGCGRSNTNPLISNISTTSNNNRRHFVDCRGHQRALIILSMLFVIIALFTGNGVFAAQRDSYKSKDMSSSNNAIPNSGAGAGAGEGAEGAGAAAGDATQSLGGPNGVTGSGSMSSNSNNANGNNKNGHASGAGAGAGAGLSAAYDSSAMTTDASRGNSYSSSSGSSSSSSSTTITGIPSSSLHKASSSSSSSSSNTIASQSGAASSASGIHRNSIDLMEEARNAGPYFDKAVSKNVTALLGKTAYLNCRVKNLGNKTMLLQVSWVRHRDIHLLTVGRYTYTSDQRFRAIHQPQTEDWMLQIKYPQHRDSGIYECQVSTTPHMSHYIHLNVVEPSTEIIGAPDLYIESGSTINLTCVILNSPEPPAYIFWNHNNAIINYDSPRGGVSVVTNKGETTTSFLLIKSARPSDSGHYQCNPSNAKPRSVTVHVLNGVSHSVSRGVPSSNAARGTSASSPLAHSLSLCVPVCVLLHLGACRTLHTLLAAATRHSATSRPKRVQAGYGCGQGSRLMRQLLGFILSLCCCCCWQWHWNWWQPQAEQHLPQHELRIQSASQVLEVETNTFRQVFEADIR
ncbi:homeobox protein prospero isoform X2 [Drosophila guanche]|uniref:homeobox protein prospero isoform X2 n=1 Tax=Drosophila guanche TaxID=7266 RepID=UPI00147217BB|nr:homeobox protein prospero isoform X2 [Drosophila guanche]